MNLRQKYPLLARTIALAFALNASPVAFAEGDVTAEEQRLREMFLRAREDNRRGVPATTPATTPAPAPAPAPKKIIPPPKAPPAPPQTRAVDPPAPKPMPPTSPVKSTPAPAPAKESQRPPAPAASGASRSGHRDPPPSPQQPPVTRPQAKAEATVDAPPKPAAVRGTPRPEPSAPAVEESPGIAQKLRNLAENLGDHLSSLPRTDQSHAMEVAESVAPAPPVKRESASLPVKKTAVVPPTMAKKPADTRPAPVLKVGPEIPKEIEPDAPVAPSEKTPSEKLMAKVGRTIPEIDVESLINGRKIDGGKSDQKAGTSPTKESLSETAESIRRSLLEDDEDAPVIEMNTLEEAAVPPVPEPAVAPKPLETTAAPPAPALTTSKPAGAAAPVVIASPSAPASGAPGMTGAVFERFVRHAMAFAMTTVAAPKPKPSLKTRPEPSLEPEIPVVEPTLFATDPEDDVPDYVKAARKLAEPLENFPALPENNTPPGLNDFVISATHQTDFDMESSSITFSGHVVVESSRFHLTCDKFVVHMLPDQKGMDYGEALGNVVIRMMEDRKPNGHTGLARSAIYRPEEGEITLSGWPRIVEKTKELVGITADAKMVLSTSGSVRTIGRNRTILKQ